MNTPVRNKPDPPLRVAIATLGRYHVLDLARELDALGHHVLFYSYVPKRRAMKFGLPAHCHVSLLPLLAPILLLTRLFRRTSLAPIVERLLHHVADNFVALRLKPCDVFISMSGIYLVAPARARRKFHAKIVTERGSVHIQAQKEILDRVADLNPKAASVPACEVSRELKCYTAADRISVPSHHAEQSFLLRDVPREKLARNPYGVDLHMFNPRPDAQRDRQLVLFVGSWSYRKGVDVLITAMTQLHREGFHLCHIGLVGDAPLASEGWFESQGPLDQSELAAWYRKARCLVLPSREDGFGLVLIQALACGCPVIGSDMTGAADLQELIPYQRLVQVIPVGDATALAEAAKASPYTTSQEYIEVSRLDSLVSWRAYAHRYDTMLKGLVHETLVKPCSRP